MQTLFKLGKGGFKRTTFRGISNQVSDKFVIQKLQCPLPRDDDMTSHSDITCTSIGKPLFDDVNIDFEESLVEALPPPSRFPLFLNPPQQLFLNPPSKITTQTQNLVSPGNTVYLNPKSGRKLKLSGRNEYVELECLPTIEETDSGGGSKGFGYEGKEQALAPYKLPRKQTKGASAGAMTSVIIATGTKPEFLSSIVDEVSASTTSGKSAFQILKALATGGMDQTAMVQKVRQKVYAGVLPKLQDLLKQPESLGNDEAEIRKIVSNMQNGGPLTLGQLHLCSTHHEGIAATGATITVHDAFVDGMAVELPEPQSVYVSHHNFPDTDVAELAVVSGALPIVFSRQQLNLGNNSDGKAVTVIASDGGVMNNVPFSKSVIATQGKLGDILPDLDPFETIRQIEFGFKNANKVDLSSSFGLGDWATGAPNGVMSQVVKLMANGRIKEIVANNDIYNGLLGTTAFLRSKSFQDAMREDFVKQGRQVGFEVGEQASQPIRLRDKNWSGLCYRMDDHLLDEACGCDIEEDPEEASDEMAERSREERGVKIFAAEAKKVREDRKAIAKQAGIIGNLVGKSLEKALAALEQLEQYCMSQEEGVPDVAKVAYAARQLCRYLPVIENFAAFRQLVGQWTSTHKGAGVLKATLRGAERVLIVRDGVDIAKIVINIIKQYPFGKAAQEAVGVYLQSLTTCDKLPGLYRLGEGIADFFENLPAEYWPQIDDDYPETSGAQMTLEMTRIASGKAIRQIVAELRKKRLGD